MKKAYIVILMIGMAVCSSEQLAQINEQLVIKNR